MCVSSASARNCKSIAVAAMLTAEELFVALARDAVAIPVATAFARVALRSRRERLGFVYVQAVLLACLAAVNAQRLATAVYWRDMALTTACEVFSLLAPRHFLGAVVASTATGAAVACGRGGLALRAFVALAVAYAAAPATTDAADVKTMKVSELKAALEAAARVRRRGDGRALVPDAPHRAPLSAPVEVEGAPAAFSTASFALGRRRRNADARVCQRREL